MSSTSHNPSRYASRGLSVLHWGLMVLMVSPAVQGAGQRFCGKQLVKMLSMLCDEFPDLHYGVKKSMIDFDKMDYSVDDWMPGYGPEQDTIISNDLMVSPNHMSTDQHDPKVPLWVTMMYPQDYGFRSNAGRNDLIPPRFRKSPREGIVNECCVRPCGINQLLKYCKTVA
ncbi:uncharacterized protein LOC128737665 [Sabethes cyaneus]|uniref:uncharacterized protein LOC128737665 n=1 Tax=Sabethes cyaneus TaxID=53552 RepID=UPI00237D3D4C|nr:uncharacterized protein LOC128737665 [Sabethes cyaneus]